MCGGSGTRLETDCEKPLLTIDGVAMIDRVLEALAASAIDHVFAVVSPKAPETHTHLERRARRTSTLSVLETAGEGYVTDLLTALSAPDVTEPILTVAADVPLLTGPVIDRVLERYRRCQWTHERRAGQPTTNTDTKQPSLTVCVPVNRKRQLGVSVGTTLESTPYLAPTGVNVVGDRETDHAMRYTTTDARLACNVNRRRDAQITAALLTNGVVSER